MTVKKIGDPTGVHIHEGAPGSNGPIVATLKTPPNGNSTSNGGVETFEDWGRHLYGSPDDFYVDVHTTQFPNGALRGQLD